VSRPADEAVAVLADERFRCPPGCSVAG